MSSQRPIDQQAIIAQIEHVLSDDEISTRAPQIRKVILSNNGSILDETTFPPRALDYLLSSLNVRLPNLRVVTIETRAEYVDSDRLKSLSCTMEGRDTPVGFELATALEAFGDHIRNSTLRKGLTLQAFEDLVRILKRSSFRLKCYFMLKPVVGMTDEEALQDVRAGISYLSRIASQYDMVINLHLNPTFVAHNTPLEAGFRTGEYNPPQLGEVIDAVLSARDSSISVFVGLNDEGCAVAGGSILATCGADGLQALETFNRTQNYHALAEFRIWTRRVAKEGHRPSGGSRTKRTCSIPSRDQEDSAQDSSDAFRFRGRQAPSW